MKVCKIIAFMAVVMGLVRAVILHTFGVQVLIPKVFPRDPDSYIYGKYLQA